MPERRLYEDRTNILVKDIKDQPPGKYIAFVQGVLGERSAVSCDGVAATTEMIMLVRHSEKISEPKGVPVCCFSKELPWAILDVERVLMMTGKEWEAAKVEDGKSHKRIIEELFGKDGIAQVIVTPEGQFPVPAEARTIEKYKETVRKEENIKMPYDDSGLYK